ncbi:MAG: hypothetical protein HC764_24545 [Pleurocapsa sp. CRU_1_2]|nr:hypothetical protein [Pleurocapsa sp. CRU_1_2]
MLLYLAQKVLVNDSKRLEAVLVLYEAVEKLSRLLELKGDRLTKNSR